MRGEDSIKWKRDSESGDLEIKRKALQQSRVEFVTKLERIYKN